MFDVAVAFCVLDCSWLIYLVTLLGVIISCCALWVTGFVLWVSCDLFCVLMWLVYFILYSFYAAGFVCLICLLLWLVFIWVSLVLVGVLLLG